MRKIFYLLISFIVAVETAYLITTNDRFYGETLRDSISFTFLATSITGFIYSLLESVDEIETKRNRKRDNKLLLLENEIRKEIENEEQN